ncbi:hypothetical protein [Rhizobium sp. WYJ-E13]|uniref:hypothetical protein n=1 Tax=Rhizobium sp. WYJ-E13 TaxID=2849093 RepID=UPI001C1EEAFB|nr:hypothetical protein [Rhizobium sp. WYJ-E13]QWW70110.1 hypothetical protein KQ933_10625 [Rhizobium sp. WYJ-E13]
MADSVSESAAIPAARGDRLLQRPSKPRFLKWFGRLLSNLLAAATGHFQDPDGPAVVAPTSEDWDKVRSWMNEIRMSVLWQPAGIIELGPLEYDELAEERHFRLAKQNGLVTSTAHFDLTADWHHIEITEKGRSFLMASVPLTTGSPPRNPHQAL